MHASDCFLCRKHDGLEPQPPGGYILQDANWMICHAPAHKGPLGTLFIESRRHILDHADFNDLEMATFAPTLSLIYGALRLRLQPQRLYLLSMMEGIPHFHAWIVPRMPQDIDRGVAFLARSQYCSEAEAADLVADLRSTLNSQWSAS
jgi:diadenosine tetraphosphate (Ap4A) HIT family hydrolase